MVENLQELKTLLASRDGATVVCFGDSVTWGSGASGQVAKGDPKARNWVNLFRERLQLPCPRAKVVNSGLGGRTAKGAFYDFDSEVAAHDPAGVIIAYGINDWNLGNQVPLDEYEFFLQRLVERTRELGALPIMMLENLILTTANDWPNPKQWPALQQVEGKATYEEYLGRARAIAERFELPVVDGYEAIRRGVEATGDFSKVMNDAAHPNDLGHKLLAEAVWQVFASEPGWR